MDLVHLTLLKLKSKEEKYNSLQLLLFCLKYIYSNRKIVRLQTKRSVVILSYTVLSLHSTKSLNSIRSRYNDFVESNRLNSNCTIPYATLYTVRWFRILLNKHKAQEKCIYKQIFQMKWLFSIQQGRSYSIIWLHRTFFAYYHPCPSPKAL